MGLFENLVNLTTRGVAGAVGGESEPEEKKPSADNWDNVWDKTGYSVPKSTKNDYLAPMSYELVGNPIADFESRQKADESYMSYLPQIDYSAVPSDLANIDIYDPKYQDALWQRFLDTEEQLGNWQEGDYFINPKSPDDIQVDENGRRTGKTVQGIERQQQLRRKAGIPASGKVDYEPDADLYNPYVLATSSYNPLIQQEKNQLNFDYGNKADPESIAEYRRKFGEIEDREKTYLSEQQNELEKLASNTSSEFVPTIANTMGLYRALGVDPTDQEALKAFWYGYDFPETNLNENQELPKSNNNQEANANVQGTSAEERYPYSTDAQNYYNYLVNTYGEDSFGTLRPETQFQAYQEMMNGNWNSLYDFIQNASADEKNAFVELMANLYPEYYSEYFDEQGNFVGPWTDEMSNYVDFATIMDNPDLMFLASGLDSARDLANDLQASGLYLKDNNGEAIDPELLALQLFGNSIEQKMASGDAGVDAQTYRDVIQALNPQVTDELSVGKYEPGGKYSANYNTSYGNDDIDWDTILSAPTYNDRINAINDIKGITMQDWFALAALASGVAADRQYRQYGQNKEQ